MNDQQTWVEALNIDPEKLAEWSQQAPAGKPILVHCLESGLVDYGEYMRWAQNYFGLPVLQPHFFQGTFDPAQLEQDKIQGHWHPWMFPVERWEGVTFVACVEPPKEISADVRYVLADPRALREAWGATSTSIRPLSSLNPENELPPLPDGVDMPAGMSAAPKPFVLDLDHTTFNFGPATEVTPTVDEPVVQFKPDLKVVPDLPVVEEAAPPPAPVIAEAAMPPVPAPMPARPSNPAPAALASDEQAAIDQFFSELSAKYEGALILKCNEQTAKLYRHDARIHPTEESAKTTINLSYPTFLRIVSKTGLPYHGYLVDSPAHSEFFRALGFEKTPACVTAIPIRFDQFQWGFVVAVGPEENQKIEFLNFTQEAADRLMQSVGGTWSKAA